MTAINQSAQLANASDSQLMIIDVQEKLVTAMDAEISTEVIKNISRIKQLASLLKIPTLISEQYPQGLGKTVAALLSEIDQKHSLLEKTQFSCCSAPQFSKQIDNDRTQFILLGMETHICVLQTALQLLALDKTVFVIADAVCSRYSRHYKNALLRMSNAGVIISNTESLLLEWLEDASHRHFKTVSKLIR